MLQYRSFDSVEIISIDRSKVLEVLRRVARRIRAQHPEVVDVRVFGSRAGGSGGDQRRGRPDCDRGLRIEGPIEQIRRFCPYFDLPVGIDLLVMTRDRWIQRLQAGDEFAKRVSRESVAL